MVDDEVDERLAGLLVDLMQHVGGDLDQVGLQLGLVPLLEHVADLGRRHTERATHQVVALGDELHVGVFDAVVHHLHEMASAVLADMRHARLTLGLRRDGLEDRLERLPGLLAAAGHHRGSEQGAFLAAGHAAADEVQSAGADRLLAADRIGEGRVAGVDDDVARLHQIGQLADHRVGRLARLDHDDRGARLLQRCHEFLHRLRGEELALAAMLGDEFLGTRIVTVEHRHLVAVTGEIAGEARSHCGQSDDTDVCFSGHAVSFRRG